MTNRLFSPNQHFANSAGVPISGGALSFFVSGTTTPQATFADPFLSVPNQNPITLDSAGRAGTIFLSNVPYKVTLADALGNTVWTEDPVYASDFSTPAQFQIFAGNPNGSLAGNQGSGNVPASAAYDTINSLLYICTTSGNAATAVWTSINSAGFSAIPTGAVVPFGGPANTIPAPFLACSGAGVSTTTYAGLFGVIGYNFGGSGATFNLPDLRGRTPFGDDNMGGTAAGRITVAGGNFDGTIFAATGGSQKHTLTQGECPASPPIGGFTGSSVTGSGTISGSNYSTGSIDGTAANGGGAFNYYDSWTALNPTISAGSLIPTGTVGNMGSGGSHTILSPSMVVNFVIKT